MALMSAQCDACDLALDVFKQMHEDKIRPNVVTYNTLVDVYGKTGQWEKAVQVLDDMRLEVRLQGSGQPGVVSQASQSHAHSAWLARAAYSGFSSGQHVAAAADVAESHPGSF